MHLVYLVRFEETFWPLLWKEELASIFYVFFTAKNSVRILVYLNHIEITAAILSNTWISWPFSFTFLRLLYTATSKVWPRKTRTKHDLRVHNNTEQHYLETTFSNWHTILFNVLPKEMNFENNPILFKARD